MPRCPLHVLLGTLSLALVACGQPSDRPADGRESAAAHAADEHAANGHVADEHAADGHAAAGEGGLALRPIMQRLGSNMTALTYALMTDDHATVTTQAAAIAAHAPISADEVARIRTVLGADMARFEAVDESVHVAAVRLHDAARARQPDRVLTALGEVQRGCVSCHAMFRERLRTDRPAR